MSMSPYEFLDNTNQQTRKISVTETTATTGKQILMIGNVMTMSHISSEQHLVLPKIHHHINLLSYVNY